MADLLGELTGNIKKAIDVVDKRQQALVEEIKKDGALLVDKAAESTEVVLENIDKTIDTIKDDDRSGDSIENLESILDTLRSDIKNLSSIVDHRAKELQLAVKKNTELVLEEVESDLRTAQKMIMEQVENIQGETDPEKKGSMLADLSDRLTGLSEDIASRIEELRDSGAETSKNALEEAQNQVTALSKTVSEMMGDFPVNLKVTPGDEPEEEKPAAKPKPVKKKKKVAKK